MHILLVSKNENLPTCKRIFQEVRNLGNSIEFFNPEYFSHSFAVNNLKFDEVDLCLNRYSSVDEFDHDLSYLNSFPNMRHVNDPQGISLTRCKLKQTVYLKNKKLPFIPSFFVKGNPKQEEVQSFLENHGDQFVSKPLRGNGGRGITLFESQRSVYSFLETSFHLKDQSFLIQPYLQSAVEYRLLLVNQIPLLLLRKTLKNDNDLHFKLNLSQNGQADFLEPDELPSSLLEKAQFIAKDLSLGLCAVDFLLHDSKPYILEINHSPGWSECEAFLKSKGSERNLTAEILEHIIK